MRYTVSKCSPNCRAVMSYPSRLSYWSNNTPSGWYLFLVDICPVCHHSSNPFRHLRRPTYLLLSSHISSSDVSIPVVLYLHHHNRPQISSTPTLSAIPITTERQYALRLVVVPCLYFPSPLPSFQPISPSRLSHISSVDVLHLLRRCIHPCCPAFPPPCSSTAVFTAELICY